MVMTFDIGGTFIKYGVVEKIGDELILRYKNEIPTQAKKIGGLGIVNRVIKLAKDLSELYPINGIGISTAGIVDSNSGEILYANSNIPEYIGINWKQQIFSQLGLNSAIENDVNAAAIGEYFCGAGQHSKQLLCLTVGTGIGGAILFDGEIYHGNSNSAGEIGYMLVRGQTYESLASTTALIGRINKRFDEYSLVKNGKEVFERAKKGDQICIEEIDKFCEYLAEGLANCISILDPDRILLGGGIMAQESYIQPLLEKHLIALLPNQSNRLLDIAFAQLGNEAGMIGAAHLYYNTHTVAKL